MQKNLNTILLLIIIGLLAFGLYKISDTNEKKIEMSVGSTRTHNTQGVLEGR